MAKYRSLSVEVNAWPVDQLCRRFWAGKELPNALQKKLEAGRINFSTNGVYIEVESGVFFATVEEMLLEKSNGDFTAIETAEFQESYKQIFEDTPKRSDIFDLEPGQAFSDGDVIGYKGENYYRACNKFVADNEDGGQSFCVKRVNHPGHVHESYDGRVRVDFYRPDEDEVKSVVQLDLKTKSLETAVYECLGAASVCWTNPSGAGEFLDDAARDIAEQLLHRIHDAGPIYG